MATPIDSLSDHQALLALKLFYDLSPDRVWDGGRKPSPERIRTLAGDLQDEAPPEYAHFLELLLDDSPDAADAHARAAFCRMLLSSFHDSPELQASADQAVATAAQPDMCIDPITGTFIVFLALAVIPRIEKGPDGLKIIPAAGLESLLKALPPVLSAAPKEIIAAIAARMGL
jgi:hypothetical protein